MNIIDYIPFGRKNAISRAELGRRTGWDDRSIRAAIKKANRAATATGIAILSSSGSHGYWKSESLEEWEQYLQESSRRQKSLYLNDAPIRELVRRAGGGSYVHVSDYYRRTRKSSPEMSGQLKMEE